MSNILITGSNGFIGFNLSRALVNHNVIGIDNDCNSDWIKSLRSKNRQLRKFYNVSILDKDSLVKIMREEKIDIVIHLAAKTGVRQSFSKKREYIDTNIFGFTNILDAMLEANVKNIIYASSSSVYGDEIKLKESEHFFSQKSIYAITKRTDELIANLYSEQFNMNIIGLRFFTVYGEFGRIDMAPMIWAKQILQNKSVTVFGDGNVERDFTYVGDVVDAICSIIKTGIKESNTFNIGASMPVKIDYFAKTLAKHLNREIKIEYKEISSQDPIKTQSDTDLFENKYTKLNHTSVESGIEKFAKWVLKYESDCINDVVSEKNTIRAQSD